MDTTATNPTATITLKYLISEEAQRAELLAGRRAKREQQLDLPVDPELLPFARVYSDGTAVINLTEKSWDETSLRSFGLSSMDDTKIDEKTVDILASRVHDAESARAWILDLKFAREISKVDAAEKARANFDRWRREALATLERWRLTDDGANVGGSWVTLGSNSEPSKFFTGDEIEEIRRVSAEHDVARHVRNAEENRIRAEADAAEARALRLAEQALVNDHGTPSQRERHADGVLPEHELAALARRVLLAPLAGKTEYVKKTRDDIEHRDLCDEEYSIKWSVHEVASPTFTAEQSEEFKSIRSIAAGIPGATVDVTDHLATLSCRCPDPSWLSARVTIKWAGLTIVQSYAL